MARKSAGMVQWQNAAFPRLRYGFDSRYPLQILPGKILWRSERSHQNNLPGGHVKRFSSSFALPIAAVAVSFVVYGAAVAWSVFNKPPNVCRDIGVAGLAVLVLLLVISIMRKSGREVQQPAMREH